MVKHISDKEVILRPERDVTNECLSERVKRLTLALDDLRSDYVCIAKGTLNVVK